MKLTNNLSIKNAMFIKHHESEFNEMQLEVLHRAIGCDVDVTKYADPKYDAYQLNNIFVGLLNGLDVTHYADPSFSSQQMSAIIEFLRKNQGTPLEENVVLIAQPQYTPEQMYELCKYAALPEAKELAKLKLPYHSLTKLFEVIEQVQKLYDYSDFALDFAIRNINRWRDNDEIDE